MRTATCNAPGRGSGAGARAIQDFRQSKTTAPERRPQRLPAFGRVLRDAFEAGLRSPKLGGGVVVVSSWDDAKGATPARVVCPPDKPAEVFDFSFLAGLDVLVLVPLADELHGEALAAAIRDAGAKLVVLAVNREPDE